MVEAAALEAQAPGPVPAARRLLMLSQHLSSGWPADMLYYALVFFLIAIVAAVFGFGGIAVGAASIAKILFILFLIAAVVSLLVGRRRI
jgi:uncharacterized membrane protein YtjA (UPF0391 family)